MSALERLSADAIDLGGKLTVVKIDDLKAVLAVAYKAIETSQTGGDDMDRALEELWDALADLTKDTP